MLVLHKMYYSLPAYSHLWFKYAFSQLKTAAILHSLKVSVLFQFNVHNVNVHFLFAERYIEKPDAAFNFTQRQFYMEFSSYQAKFFRSTGGTKNISRHLHNGM